MMPSACGRRFWRHARPDFGGENINLRAGPVSVSQMITSFVICQSHRATQDGTGMIAPAVIHYEASDGGRGNVLTPDGFWPMHGIATIK
jgi:hypothetical protein